MLKSNAECVAGQPPTPVRPFFLDPHAAAAAVVLRPSPATFVRPSVGVMNKCQTSSPSELDPCAPRVRRESGGEWRYEFVRTKIYYNNVEPTRRERGREGGTVSLSVWPRGGWVILPSERAAARRPLARPRPLLPRLHIGSGHLAVRPRRLRLVVRAKEEEGGSERASDQARRGELSGAAAAVCKRIGHCR